MTWPSLGEELGYGDGYLTDSYAAGLAGMALGCIFFIPAADLIGRKPVYLFASLIMVLANVGQATFQTRTQYIVLQTIAGLAGSVNDTIIQMTVSTVCWTTHLWCRAYVVRITDRGSFFRPPACNNEWYLYHNGGRWRKALSIRTISLLKLTIPASRHILVSFRPDTSSVVRDGDGYGGGVPFSTQWYYS